jgi:amino acid permease
MTTTMEKTVYEAKIEPSSSSERTDPEMGSVYAGDLKSHELHRKLNSKQVQLFAIGGAIGMLTPLNDCQQAC